ncbi:MAG TPA: PD-(D/E)XK motif protein [Xanthobacteraceae bacterium]|jgi:hypothetical protein
MPWDDIRTPDADYNVRLAAGSGAVPTYWGKDTEAQCLLIVELAGDHTAQYRQDGTSVHGVRVDLRQVDAAANQRLVLTLEKHVDRDLFFSLCESLVAGLQPVTDSATALAVTLAHIRRWKAFLAGRKTGLLTPEELRGLFAELQFLRNLYGGTLSQVAAVEAWCGADGVHQDFVFADKAVEVKSLSGRDRSTVRISSADQLESIADHLFLMTYRLSDLPDARDALSLNALVAAIESELAEADAIEGFSIKLASYGYAPLHEYDVPKLVVSGAQAYQVIEGFPRLIRSALPEGILGVSYEIKLENIASFCCEQNIILRSA